VVELNRGQDRTGTEEAPSPSRRARVPGTKGPPLDALADRVRKDAPVPIYPCLDIPAEDRFIWSGEDVGEFLSFAKKVGVPLLYLCQRIVPEDTEDPKELDHAGETAFVEVAFLLDGQVHVFSEVATWVPEAEESEPETGGLSTDLAGAEKQLDARREEIVREFLAELQKRPGPIDPSRFAIDQSFRRFVLPKLSGTTPRYSWMGIPRDGSPLDLLVQRIAEEISAGLLEKEFARVEPLVPDCVAWAWKLGIRSLSKSDVDAYLVEKGVTLSSEGHRLLWTKAKLAVKVGRTK
jgi:hypothetical protein